jgi:hypothetical protein
MLRKAQPFLWIAIFIAASVTPQYAQDPKVCAGGANDGTACTVAGDCPGGACTPDDVRAYAKGCYDRLKIKTTDFPGPFKCKDGKQLVVKDAGVVKDINLGGKANPNAAADFPATCDYPSWLPNGAKQCYGNSYIQKIKVTDDVQAALLCRHKLVWSDDDKDFNDIAMILHNDANGETCWFQTSDTDTCRRCTAGANAGAACAKNADCPGSACSTLAAVAHCDGTNVPAPHTNPAKSFFLTPKATSKINCVRCHDNGPWMNSRWMNNTITLEDDQGKYVNNGYGFSTAVDVDGLGLLKAWAPTTFVVVGRDGLTVKKADSCDTCHRIHAKEVTPDPKPAFNDRNYQTFANWLDYAIGNDSAWADKFPPKSNATGQGFDVAYWMPVGHGEANAANWKTTYKSHIDKLRACMAAKGAGGVGACKTYVAQLNLNPAGAPGARMLASLNGGATFPYLSEGSSPRIVSNDISIPPHTRLLLRWEANSSFKSCAIEASFPPGVTSSNGVETASNWGLPDSPQDMGELTIPGEYRFDLYCDNNFGGNLIFQISGPPPVYLSMQPIINQVPGGTANAGTSAPGPNSVDALAQPSDLVNLFWSASNVMSGSCILSAEPPGQSSTDQSGFIQISPLAGTNQTYFLTCTGNDQNRYTVDARFTVPTPTPTPTPSPTPTPTPSPTPTPTPSPTPTPTPSPTPTPTPSPTPTPTPSPTPPRIHANSAATNPNSNLEADFESNSDAVSNSVTLPNSHSSSESNSNVVIWANSVRRSASGPG